MNKQATTQKPEIQSASIARGKDKATGETFYVVKSDSSDTTWYTVRWDQAACEWRCNCASHKPCKHERAVNEVLKIRRMTIAATMGPGAVATVKEWQAQEDKKLAETSEELRFNAWHGSNRDAERAQPAAETVKGNLNGERGFNLFR